MRTRWQQGGKEYQVVAPVSLIVSAFAPVTDVTKQLTPQLRAIDEPSYLLLFDVPCRRQSPRRFVPGAGV